MQQPPLEKPTRYCAYAEPEVVFREGAVFLYRG